MTVRSHRQCCSARRSSASREVAPLRDRSESAQTHGEAWAALIISRWHGGGSGNQPGAHQTSFSTNRCKKQTLQEKRGIRGRVIRIAAWALLTGSPQQVKDAPLARGRTEYHG